MLHTFLAVAAALSCCRRRRHLVLVVSGVRRTHGEPLATDGHRSLDALEQRDAQRRVNKGASGGAW